MGQDKQTSKARFWLRGAVYACVLAAVGGTTMLGKAQDGMADRDLSASLQTIARSVPTPLPGHPGNVFLAGEEVVLPVPRGVPTGAAWRVLDEKGKEILSGTVNADASPASLGALAVGWYRLECLKPDGQTMGFTNLAVLEPLAEPTPQDSPVCIDMAAAWFARFDAETQSHFASLAALAGANWVRDRLSWDGLEPQRDQFEPETTTYDTSAAAQKDQQLKTLQVIHTTPGWASQKGTDGEEAWKRFPRDLRDSYRFFKEAAARFRGTVQAWEPWNEANIINFGGQPTNEMASLQKSGYLGVKAGNPDATVGWNVFAGPGTELNTESVLRNETWPYYETYNIHSYDTPRDYLDIFETSRRGACGRPIWLTECGVRVLFETDPPEGDITPEDELRQARFLARSYTSSLYAGVNRHFFFILGNYTEVGIQFGLLRHDQTPRPGYVAFAALGRALAGARCLGRMQPDGAPEAWVYAFRSRPGGKERDLLVAWNGADKTTPEPVLWPPLPDGVRIEKVIDYLGRDLGASLPTHLGLEPVYVVLAKGDASRLALEPPPTPSEVRSGAPSPIVLQTDFPLSMTQIANDCYELRPNEETDVTFHVYNFGKGPEEGVVEVEGLPEGWLLKPQQWNVRVEPMGRETLTARITLPDHGRAGLFGDWVTLRGDFDEAGNPVLAFRLMARLAELEPAKALPILSTNDPAKWTDNIVQRATMTHAATDDNGMGFEMHFTDADPWGYPGLTLDESEIPSTDFDGLALTIQVTEGKGIVRVMMQENNGTNYLLETGIDASVRTPQRAVVLFRNAIWQSHSKPDPDGALQPGNIRGVLVGINAPRHSTVRMSAREMEWVKF